MFNFVIDCADEALEEYLHLPEEAFPKVFTRGDLNWCLQTYLLLAARDKLFVQCSNRLQKDCINIIHSYQLLQLKGQANHFLVCVRADYPKRRWAQYHLVQNGDQLAANTSYIPHWVQPGLLRRSPDRVGVKRVGYAGAPIKGNLACSAEEWQRMFDPHGIEFVSLSSGKWHDLSSIDVLIGIRSFNRQAHSTKPPTKLFNAWHAHIPFIGGYDSAFTEVGTPGKDYLRAGSPQEVVEAVLRLSSEPALYTILVQNGLQKARQFSTESIAEQWEKILTGPVLSRYQQWRSRPLLEQTRFKLMQDVGFYEQKSRQLARRLLNSFPRRPMLPKPV